ncbi:MAG TPA: diguanylate cyclase [Burkholderiales bacterium]|nr:diguanylate cyclase [Burkholderiales bacterium]
MRNLSTRNKLILLVVASALPALALTLYSTLEERDAAKANARADLVRLTRLATREQEQIIEGVRQTMVASSQVLTALQADAAACNRYFARLLAQNRGRYHSMGLFNLDGYLFCNAVPWTPGTYSGDRDYFQLAKSSGQFSVGSYQMGRVTGLQGVNFGYPVRNAEDKVTGIAFIGFDLASFNRVATSTPLPPEGILTVVDRNATVIARHPAEDRVQAGRKLENPRVLKPLFSTKSGVFETTRLADGVDRLYVHDAVAENPDGTVPIRILVSLPLSVIFADANRALTRNLVGIVVATLLLVLGAWYGTELFVLRSIRSLLDAARRVRSGDLGARTRLLQGNDELSQVGQAFDEMAETLQRRDVELRKAVQELKEQALTDPLTGLYNRRYLRDVLARELLRAKRRNGSLAAVMVDVDHFKRINDSLGHEAGDMVLKELSALLRRCVRGSDTVCRYGGEEFALLLPDATLEGAQHKAEEIRAAVKALDLRFHGKRIGVLSASFGVALFPNHAADAEPLLGRADEALYHAKGAGRDRVLLSDAAAPAHRAAATDPALAGSAAPGVPTSRTEPSS